MVIINSVQVASDLLDKRGTIYSDRIQSESTKYIGYTDSIASMLNGDAFKEQRRMIAKVIGSRAQVETFSGQQEHATHRFLNVLLSDPDDFVEHIKKYVAFLMIDNILIALLTLGLLAPPSWSQLMDIE